MFRNSRRSSFENFQSCQEPPVVISSLLPFIPSNTDKRDRIYHERYLQLREEFKTATQIRQNTATLTNGFTPTPENRELNRKTIVFPEYEPQKQCLYVRPKGLLQVDPSKFQITPSELTMLRKRHHIALTQVDVSTATGEVRNVKTPSSLEKKSVSMSCTLPSLSPSRTRSDNNTLSSMNDDTENWSASTPQSLTKQKKGYYIPLPRSPICSRPTK